MLDYSNYDVIIGYRADDSYFSFAQDFLNGTISYRQLTLSMKLGELGKQYVLKNEKAFSKIKFIEAKTVDRFIYYPQKIKRDNDARNKYFNNKKMLRKKDDIYSTDILNKEMKNNDPSLR